MSDQGQSNRKFPDTSAWCLVPVLVSFAIVFTMWVRYENPWSENDTAVLTKASRAVISEGTVSPSEYAYDHGFGYPTTVATLSLLTGLSVLEVQVNLLPWLTLVTALMAFVAFREITRSNRAGAIAAALLLVQPDFLFVSQRGSHEKVTWTLVLALIFILITSLARARMRQVAPYVIAFYLCGFALMTTNAFFASSLTTIVLLALLGSLIVSQRLIRVETSRRLLPRLTYVTVILSALTYVVVFYLYSPAGSNLANLGRAADRLAALYLNVETRIESSVEESTQFTSNAQVSSSQTTVNPYQAQTLTWVSGRVFILLTLFTWLLLVATLICWIVLGISFVRRGVARSELPIFLIWAFVAASGVQIALSVASDYAGVLGSNLQLRLFPVFTVFAVPLVVSTVTRHGLPSFYLPLKWRTSLFARRMALFAGTFAFMYFSVAAVLKATNDPLVTNKWTFYSTSEAFGIRWGNQNLDKTFIWADFDERIGTASELELPDDGGTEAIWTRGTVSSDRYYFISDVIEDRSTRIDESMPNTSEHDRIYDNGLVQVTHVVPVTPYQP